MELSIKTIIENIVTSQIVHIKKNGNTIIRARAMEVYETLELDELELLRIKAVANELILEVI